MKNLIVILTTFLITSFSFAQIEDPDDTFPPGCNLINNPDMVFPGVTTNNCLNFILDNDIPGWNRAFGTPDWRPNINNCIPKPVNLFIYDFLNTEFLPDDVSGNVTFFGYKKFFEDVGRHSMDFEGITARNLVITPNTKYILSYHKSDGLDKESIEAPNGSYTTWNQRVSKNKGMNVYINRTFDSFQNWNMLRYFHYPSTNTITNGAVVGPNPTKEILFEENRIEVIADNTIEFSWSQTVTSFTSPNDDSFQFLTFTHALDYNYVSIGNQYNNENEIYAINLDRVELIEDRLQETPSSYELNCGEDVTIGIELCDVANMEYQWWDVTGNPVQLTDLSADAGSSFDNNGVANSLQVNYGVQIVNANGSQITLTNFDGTSQLELRRVFPSTFSDLNLTINNQLNSAENTAQVTVSCDGNYSCPTCDEIGQSIVDSIIYPTSCDNIQFMMPESPELNCYDVTILINNIPFNAVPGFNDVMNLTSGGNPITVILTDSTTGVECFNQTKSCEDVSCPNCEEVNDFLQTTLNNFEATSCGEYTLEIPLNILDCYEIKFVVHGELNIINTTSFNFSFSESGEYPISLVATEIGGNRCGPALPGTINVPDCFEPSPCVSCQKVLDGIHIQQEMGCGVYSAFVPSGISDCYRIDYYVNTELQGALSEGATTINLPENIPYTIGIAVVDITTTPETRCAKRPHFYDIDCHDTSLKPQFSISPNPASTEITLEFRNPDIKEYKVLIRTMKGEIILRTKNQSKIKIDSLPLGLYFVELITTTGEKHIKKLIIN